MDTQKSEDPDHFEQHFTDLHMRQLLTELSANRIHCVHNEKFCKHFKSVCDNLTSEVCFDLWRKPDFCPQGSYHYISPFLNVISQGYGVSPILYVMLEKLEPHHLKEVITSPDLKILHLAIASSAWGAANLIIMHMNTRLESRKYECINVEDDEGKSVVGHAISNMDVLPSTLDAIIEVISNTDEFYKHFIVKEPMVGNTPLHNAIQKGYLHLVKKLTTFLKPEQLLALLEIQNKEGKTPLDIADQKCPTSRAALFSTRQLMSSILRSHVSDLNKREPQPELNGKLYSRNYIAAHCFGNFNTTSSPQPKSLFNSCQMFHNHTLDIHVLKNVYGLLMNSSYILNPHTQMLIYMCIHT